MASCNGFWMPGLLNSATTSGMPFTNSTASGMTCPRPLLTSLLPVGQAIGNRALEQHLGRRLVNLHQSMPGRLLQVTDSAGDTHVVEPWPAVTQVELTQGRWQPIRMKLS